MTKNLDREEGIWIEGTGMEPLQKVVRINWGSDKEEGNNRMICNAADVLK